MNSLLMRRPDLADCPLDAPSVELATPDDARDLAALLDLAFDESWDSERVHRDLLDDATVAATFLIRDGAEIVATASARYLPAEYPNAGYLHWVASNPSVRGRGLGRGVTIATLNRFNADDVAQAVLETEDHRLEAIAVYLGLGFVPQYRDQSHEGRWSQIFSELSSKRTSDRSIPSR